jgi:hypothetical protein
VRFTVVLRRESRQRGARHQPAGLPDVAYQVAGVLVAVAAIALIWWLESKGLSLPFLPERMDDAGYIGDP